jgi:hypothetical protein
MAIDRSTNAWPKEFSYELGEVVDTAVILEVQGETRVHSPNSSQERELESDFDHRIAA